jgi:hypothetical protein
MAKKTLNEATVRRFQRLANLKPINEMYHKRDEEEMEEGMYGKRDDEEVMKEEEEVEMDVEMGADEAPEAEMEMDAEMDGDLELTDEEAQAIIDLGAKLEAAMGEEAPEMDDAPAPEMEMDAEMDAEEEIMESLRGISYVPSQTEVVNEVAKRVAKRLKAAKLHEAKLNRALGRK